MRHGIWAAVLIGFLVGPYSLRAQDTYTIKIKEPGQGDSQYVEKQSTEKMSQTMTDAGGKAIPVPNTEMTETYVYRETVLETKEGQVKPTRLRREYEKAQEKTGGKAATLSFEGKTVLIEKKGDSYHFQIEGGQELTGADAKLLDKEFNLNKDDVDFKKVVLPQSPVKVNEAWKIDTSPLTKSLAKNVPFVLDGDKVTGTGKLLKVYEKGGHQFGVMEMDIVFPIKGMPPELKMDVKEGAKFIIHFTADGCIDGSTSSGTINVKMDFDMQAGMTGPTGAKMEVTTTSNNVEQETDKELPKG